MKLQGKKQEKISNQKNQKIKLKIGNVGKILNLLRDGMYSNPIQVLVQEYVSNAIDIHNEIGQKKPVEITLPTSLNPFFKVRDFGSGLSEQQMNDVYTQYGVSTKDKDNTQQGGFGLGCKSFWAYTKSFFVKSYYNGVATEYLAHLGDSEEGDFEIISQEKTNEPNGLEVYGSVQKEDFNEFAQAVFRCSAFMKTRPIIKGQEIPEWYKNLSPKLQIGEVSFFDRNDLPILSNGYGAKCFMLIDNVVYPLSYKQKELSEVETFLSLCQSDTVAVCPVEIGELDITPSRDTLRDTKKTNSALKIRFSKATKDLLDYAKEKSNTCKNLMDFFSLAFDINSLIDVKKYLSFEKSGFKFSYGHTYSNNTNIVCSNLMKEDMLTECYLTRNRNGKQVLKKDNLNSISKDIYLNGKWVFSDGNETLQWQRVRYYLEQNPNDSVIIVNNPSANVLKFWQSQLNVLYLGDMERPPKGHFTSNKVAKGKVCLHYIRERKWSSEVYRETIHFNLDTDTLKKEALYLTMDRNSINYDEITKDFDLLSFVREVKQLGYAVIAVSTNVEEKIKDMEGFISVRDFIENPLEYLIVDDSHINYVLNNVVDSTIEDIAKYVSKLDIEDEELLKSSKAISNKLNEIEDKGYSVPPIVLQKAVNEKAEKEIEILNAHCDVIEEKLKSYPLLDNSSLSKNNKDDFTLYINAKLSSL